VKYDAEAWVRLAQEAGMKYMVLIAKHHDGFSQFDSQLTEHDIMATPYGKDIVKQFVEACHKHGMKVGLYYSTRDWFHPDYLVGDNAKYDAWYRGQIEELLSHYGKIDVMWFDHVGGRDWGKWRFDELFAMMYRRQPGLLVNNRAARFCGPASAEDRGPATPDIRKMTDGDFDTPEQQIGAMNLKRDWESCMILSPTPQHDGWSYRSSGQTRPLEECIRMLASIASGGGNLLLNFGPDQFGEFRPEEVAIAKGIGAWLKKYGAAIYGTHGGPFTNGKWGGSTHRGTTVYLHVFDWPGDTLRLGALPQKITQATVFPGGTNVACVQTARGVDVTVPAAERDTPVTVIELTLDQPVPRGQQVGSARSRFEDQATYGLVVSENATFKRSSPSVHDKARDHSKSRKMTESLTPGPLTRRQLLAVAAAGLAGGRLESLALAQVSATTGGTVRDRLWIFTCAANSDFPHIGRRSVMTPAEGAFYLGVPNIIVVQSSESEARYGRLEPPLAPYTVALRPLQRVVWSVVGSGGLYSPTETEEVFQLARSTPNFTGVMLDDFFTGQKEGKRARLTVQELAEIRRRLEGINKKLQIFVTLYVTHLDLPLRDYLELIDVITLWTGSPAELANLEANLTRAERLAPKTRKMLGCYVVDYGRKEGIPVSSMKLQCEMGLRWLREGRIEGLIFLGNTTMDLGFESVAWTRQWIQQVGDTKL
jgi:alpha-L-fucosidase